MTFIPHRPCLQPQAKSLRDKVFGKYERCEQCQNCLAHTATVKWLEDNKWLEDDE